MSNLKSVPVNTFANRARVSLREDNAVHGTVLGSTFGGVSVLWDDHWAPCVETPNELRTIKSGGRS